MSHFAPTQGGTQAAPKLVENGPFWPSLDVAWFRQCVRLHDTVTDGRVIATLRTAREEVNADLAAWRAAQQAKGHATLEALPHEMPEGEPSPHVHNYLTAVHGRAAALLTDYYEGMDTADAGTQRQTEQSNAREAHLREAVEAVRRLQGEGRAVVELI